MPTSTTSREAKLLVLFICVVVALLSVLGFLYAGAHQTAVRAYELCQARNHSIRLSNAYYDRIAATVSRSQSLDSQTKNSLVSDFQSVKYPTIDCGSRP